MTEVSDPRLVGTQNRMVLEAYLKPLPEEGREAALDELQRGYESSVSPHPPQPGECAPDFELEDPQQTIHRLSSYEKPIVLSFFRGGWCPACMVALKAVQRRYPAITTYGGDVLAISPDSAEANRRTAKEYQFEFPLLTDANNEVADLYGLRDNIAPLLLPIYQKHNVPFPDDLDRLDVPFPATFILRSDREIVETFVNRDPAVRMDPEDIAGVVRRL